MRVRVIVNRSGGAIRAKDGSVVEAELADAFAQRGVVASIILCGGSEIEHEARAALDETGHGRSFDAIVAGGGDGTISAVAGVLAGTKAPLGILPLGTLNHFARDLGLPTNPDEAAGVIAAGHARQVDVAEVSGRVFVNNSSIGLYAEMVADRDHQRRATGRGKWPAMLLAAWHAVRRFPLRRLSVHAEGWTRPCETPLLFVGNNAYTIDLLCPGGRSVLNRGELWLYVAACRSRLGMLRLGIRAMLGRPTREGDFEARLVPEAEIRSRGSRPLRVSVDGEVAAMHPPLRYRSRPGDLHVLAPEPR